MANVVQNPFYKNPHIAQIGNNLVQAFMGDGGRGEAYREHARLYKAQADKAERENVAHQQIGTLIKQYSGTSPVAAEWLASAYGTAIQAGVKPSDVSNMVLGLVANSGRPTSEVANAWTGAGHTTGKDTAFGVDDRERVAKRENDAAMNRTTASAGISANASVQNNRERLQFEKDNPTEERVKGTALNTYLKDNPNSVGAIFLKPDHVPQGAHVAPTPGDPRYPQGGGIPAPKPPGADRFVQSEDPNKPGSNIWKPATDGLPGPAPHVPKPPVDPAASANMLNTIELNVLGNVGGWDANAKAPKAEFVQQYGARMVDAKKRAGEVFQATKNAGEAERAYLEALGLKPGETIEYPGAVSRMWNGTGKTVVRPAEGALPPVTNNIASQFAPKGAAPAAPTAPAAPADTLPPEAAAALKEGVHTQFGNGQTWTLQNGAPVRVQ